MVFWSLKSQIKRSPNRGVTQVETLVAVGVLMVLMGCAWTFVPKVMMMASQTNCASNMRQIGRALLMYAAEHEGNLPATTHTTGNSRFRMNGEWVNTIDYSWIYLISDYLGNVDEVRICPADEKERQKRIRELNATSYLLNDLVFDSGESGTPYNRIQNIPYAGKTPIMFISARPVSRTWDHSHSGAWTVWSALLQDVAVDRHRVGKSNATRTNGSANYLFADGHVENIPAVRMRKQIESGVNPGAVPVDP